MRPDAGGLSHRARFPAAYLGYMPTSSPHSRHRAFRTPRKRTTQPDPTRLSTRRARSSRNCVLEMHGRAGTWPQGTPLAPRSPILGRLQVHLQLARRGPQRLARLPGPAALCPVPDHLATPARVVVHPPVGRLRSPGRRAPAPVTTAWKRRPLWSTSTMSPVWMPSSRIRSRNSSMIGAAARTSHAQACLVRATANAAQAEQAIGLLAVRWLVDGMNVIGTRPDAWWKDRRAAMIRLVDMLERWAAVERRGRDGGLRAAALAADPLDGDRRRARAAAAARLGRRRDHPPAARRRASRRRSASSPPTTGSATALTPPARASSRRRRFAR